LGQKRVVLEKSVVNALYNEITRLSEVLEFSPEQCCDVILGLVAAGLTLFSNF
jgi:hypothetical protein